MQKSPLELFRELEGPAKTRHIYTVSELTRDIKIILDNTFCEVWVEGEVSGYTKIATGTAFFNLKDNSSLLKCILFPSSASAVKFAIKDGISLICFGRISVYEKEGRYQLYVQAVEPKGLGSCQLALEQLKERLEKEGLFSPLHKRSIPYLPSRIGIVTSLSGAAIKDILKVLETRFKDVHIIINPVRVQGEGAKEEIAGSIREFNLYNQKLPKEERVEVMIVGRGGGSIEDLWAFNEEIVARAIYNSQIPVISAVGHERDISLSDLVADLRAPTPSIAAERVIPKKEDLREKLDGLIQALKRAFLDIVTAFQERIDEAARYLSFGVGHALELDASKFDALRNKLALVNPTALIYRQEEKIADLCRQVRILGDHFIKIKKSELTKAIEKLSSLSPLNVLSRGYSVTFKVPGGEIIRDAQVLRQGQTIKTRVAQGEILSQVKRISPGHD